MEDSMKKQIGKEIYKQRVLNGYTQDKLGEALGYSKQTISAWENGRLTPTNEAFESIKSLFHVDPRNSNKKSLEEKEMCLSIKPLNELKTESEIEYTIEQVLETISIHGADQFVIKYILKRMMFVGAAEAFCLNRISIMYHHDIIRNCSWRNTIDDMWTGILMDNRFREYLKIDDSMASFIRKKLVEKEELLRYGCEGPSEGILDRTFEEQEELIPLKGEDREIVKRGYDSLEDLLCVLPSTDNSIITSVLVYLNIIAKLIWEA
jgi:transcriptional regulator with XRE-family HTH domain